MSVTLSNHITDISGPQTDLEVTVHNAHVVEVFDSVQNLLNELTGVFLCVEALLYDTVEEFPARHSGQTGRDLFIKAK